MNTAPHALKTLNTFGVEAWAQSLHTLHKPEAIAPLLDQHGAPDLLLGGGSNVLLVQQSFQQVWLNRLMGRTVLARDTRTVRIRLQAGEPWDAAVAWCLAQGAFGLENLSLIPGCCGAAPIQNIGAYGVEIAQFIHRVEAMDLNSGAVHHLAANECDFAYRHSIFRSPEGKRWLILAIELNLSATFQPTLDYPGLRQLDDQNAAAELTAQQIRQAVIALRRSKLPDPSLLGNAGSFFKNPIVASTQLEQLLSAYPQLPHWPHEQGAKLSAAWLIQHCGLKGYRQGDAAVHANHALILVNHGMASGAELWQLAQNIQSTVHQKTGVRLEPEPQILH
ncbi:MAG: UDP-N-acetylmuramate dehydrogenase [Xanthomonadales bacterium]|nr:UDP-N-acetylmuramate dehydrogenase [Xanthomonadales bacterium]